MNIVFEDLPKMAKKHKLLRLTPYLGLVCSTPKQKPLGFFSNLSKFLRKAFGINSFKSNVC